MTIIVCGRRPRRPQRGWRALVHVELIGGASWLPIPADGDGLTYSGALDLAVEHVRAGRRARIVAPDGSMGREIPMAYARECSVSVGPLFDDDGGANANRTN